MSLCDMSSRQASTNPKCRINFAEQGVNAKGIGVGSEEGRKMIWMRETRIRHFMQMELEAYRDKLDWLLRCHHCIVDNFPEEHCPPMPIPIPSDQATNLARRAEVTKKGILSLTFKMIKKKYCPLNQYASRPFYYIRKFHHARHRCRALNRSWRLRHRRMIRPRVILSGHRQMDGKRSSWKPR